jgi:hypothetical protein
MSSDANAGHSGSTEGRMLHRLGMTEAYDQAVLTTAARADSVAPVVTTQGDLDRAPRLATLNWLMWLSVLLATVPIVAAVVRALTTDWMPVGDNAYFTVRSRDVLTQHHPLVGAWSSGSHAIDASVNNLGPLQLDLLAPFTKLAPVAGTATGVGLVQLAALVGIAVTLRRLAGPLVVILAMAVSTGIAWTLGSALLVETRQHHYLVLPFLCFLVLVWALSSGAVWALPWAAFVGSLLLQTHLTYAYLVVGLMLWALVGFGFHARRARAETDEWSAHRRRLLRWGGVTLVVLLLSWIQPIIDQFFGTGNLGNVLRASGSGESLPGGRAVRLVATVVATPPWWARPGFTDFDPQEGLATAASTALGFAVVGPLLLGVAWLAWRTGSRLALAGVGTALVGVLLAIISAASIPAGGFGFHAGNYRWLWPISAFVMLAIASGVALGTGPPRPPHRSSRAWLVPAGVLAATTVFAALSIPAAYHAGDKENERRMPTAARLIDQLDDFNPDDFDIDGPVFYDRRDVFFGEPYTYTVLFKLQELGIEFTVDDDDVHRFGRQRRDDGQASHTLTFVWGEAARDVPEGAHRVAFVPGQRDTETVGLLLSSRSAEDT